MSLLLCDHHVMFLRTLAEALEERDHVIVGATSDPTDVPALVDDLLPDILLTDVDFPQVSGLEIARQVRRRRPSTAIVLLSGSNAPEVRSAFDNKLVDGLVSKCGGIAALETALATVRGGERALVGWCPTPTKRRRTPLDLLTPREREVLALLTDGSSTGDIADRLGVSVNTVRTHVRSVLHKLGVHHRTMAIQAALTFERAGVLETGGAGVRSTQYVT